MRSIREFYETKVTFISTRDENVIGALRDTADCVLEQLQNEECSLAHHVRALSILLWLVGILENRGIPLDRQTRDEVEDCAYALTGEYLRRGRYRLEDVCWALEWASPTTLEEIAPQVPDSFFEDVKVVDGLVDLTRLAHLHRLARLHRLECLARLMGLTDLTDLVGLADLADLAGLADLLVMLERHQSLADLKRHLSNTAYVDIPRYASCARLALDDSPESKH